MQRRHFLKLTASGGLVLGVPGVAGLFEAPSRWHALAHPDLLAVLGDTQVRAIGEGYRAQYPSEDDPATLAAAIIAEDDGSGVTLHTMLEQRLRDDFAHGQTVQIDGWVLARTEARQSALYSWLVA